MRFRLHAFEPCSRANGPGRRAVVWFQGCTLGCPACFNPDSHDPVGGYACATDEVAEAILRLGDRIEGVSISGGEPMQQPEALLDLLVRLIPSGLSRLLFSGYSLSEILSIPSGSDILHHLDVLIAGRYEHSKHMGRAMLGSTNQEIHLISARYSLNDLLSVPTREIILHSDGSIIQTGLDVAGPLDPAELKPKKPRLK